MLLPVYISQHCCFLADVIAICHIVVDVVPPGQMLKPVYFCGVDVVATWFML